MGLQELLGCWIVSTVTQMQETGISMPVGKGFRTLALWYWVDAMEKMFLTSPKRYSIRYWREEYYG